MAVKVLRPELAAVLGADRFLQEIKVTANLQHPHILPLFDSGEADGFLYYVMPVVEGDARSDVYALGCVVYEMVAGHAPFEGTTAQALLAKHAVDTVPGLRARDPTIPVFVERAVERALAKSPADRFPSARTFADVLTSGTVVAPVGPRRWRRPAVAGVAVLLVVWGV